jgi:hypothetical protein
VTSAARSLRSWDCSTGCRGRTSTSMRPLGAVRGRLSHGLRPGPLQRVGPDGSGVVPADMVTR